MTLFHWSKTAASNGTADITCPFPEGMGASALNDGARGMMAAVAKYRDDMAGAIVTTGTLNSYSVLSYQGFDSLADMNGQEIAFSPHVTNGDTVLLNVDFLGAKPLRSAPGVELLAGTLVLGTPYMALYNNTDGAWYLKGYYSSPYNVPFLSGIEHWDTITPNSSFIFPIGQALSRTVYWRTFAKWGVSFGAGDGATTFNAPDVRGRFRAALDNMGGGGNANRLTATYFGAATGFAATSVGATGGGESQTLTQPQLPNVTLVVHVPQVSSSQANIIQGNAVAATPLGGGANAKILDLAAGNGNITIPAFDVNTSALGAGSAHPIVPPTIVCNYIIRIL